MSVTVSVCASLSFAVSLSFEPLHLWARARGSSPEWRWSECAGMGHGREDSEEFFVLT